MSDVATTQNPVNADNRDTEIFSEVTGRIIQPQISPWDEVGAGVQWCDCGETHTLTRRDAEQFFDSFEYEQDDLVPHLAVIANCQSLWHYISICEYFLDHVKVSAEAINGKVDDEYSYSVAIDIVGYFCKTWQGCPQENQCDGGRNAVAELEKFLMIDGDVAGID